MKSTTLNRLALLAAAAAGVADLGKTSHAAPILYEGFDYPAGTDVHGQLNTSIQPAGDTWTKAGAAAATFNIDVTAGSLTSPAGTPTGNKATIVNPATASTERLNFGAINSGTVWYSMTFNATVGAATVNTDNGAYFVGLSSFDDNGDVDSGAAPAITNTAARLALRLDPDNNGTMNIALTNTSAQLAASYSPLELAQNADHFVIVALDIAAGASNDTARLWVNPSVGTFDPTTTPHTLMVTGQADMVDVKSFFLRQTGGLPENVSVDEIRVGTTFGDVVPEPGSLSLLALAGAGMLARRRRTA